MKYYIIAGEASGDLHGSNLIKEICKLDSSADLICWGGDLMQQAGAKLIKHYRDLAFMGFIEVIKNIRTITKNLRFCKQSISEFQPDALILIDYPGFNLRIAEYAKKNGIKVFYYISPQVWAWKQSRVKQIKKNVDKMFTILPFEKDFYNKFNYNVEFVGHPLVDAINIDHLKANKNFFFEKNNINSTKPLIAILPGSRKQEIQRILPIMLSVIDKFSEYQFVIAGVSSINQQFYTKLISNYSIPIIYHATYELLLNSQAAIVTSGTATLETAIFETPQVVCYKADAISYFIGKQLVKIKYISLVNLIANKPVIVELVQGLLTSNNLALELNKLLKDSNYRKKMINEYQKIKSILGSKGASATTAKQIYDFINNI